MNSVIEIEYVDEYLMERKEFEIMTSILRAVFFLGLSIMFLWIVLYRSEGSEMFAGFLYLGFSFLFICTFLHQVLFLFRIGKTAVKVIINGDNVEFQSYYNIQKFRINDVKELDYFKGNWFMEREEFLKSKDALVLKLNSGKKLYVRAQIKNFKELRQLLMDRVDNL